MCLATCYGELTCKKLILGTFNNVSELLESLLWTGIFESTDAHLLPESNSGEKSVIYYRPILTRMTQLRNIWKSEIVNNGDSQRTELLSYMNRTTLDIIGLVNYNFNALDSDQMPNELSTAFSTLTSPENKTILSILQMLFPVLG